jgi:hypothetical protein
MNRRRKAILFLTLIVTGLALRPDLALFGLNLASLPEKFAVQGSDLLPSLLLRFKQMRSIEPRAAIPLCLLP